MDIPKEPLTISYLNHKAFKECKRLWLYRYAPGNSASGEALWEIIREGRLLPSTALLGRVVDDVITAALRYRKRSEKWPPKPTSAVRKVLDDYLDFSEKWANTVSAGGKWPRRTGKQAIDRIYYGANFERSELDELVARAEELVFRWFNLPFIADLEGLDLDGWRVPESGVTPHFLLGNIKVFAKFDFMTVEPGCVRIFDWKTGNVQRGEQGARAQLNGYADYARHALGIPLQQIELIGVWLSANYVDREPADESLIGSLEEEWGAQVDQVSESLIRLENGSSDLDAEFPLTENKWLCQGCVFRACPQHPRHGLH